MAKAKEQQELNADQLDDIIEGEGDIIEDDEAEAAFAEAFEDETTPLGEEDKDLEASGGEEEELGDADKVGSDKKEDSPDDDDEVVDKDKEKPSDDKDKDKNKDEDADYKTQLRKANSKYGELNSKYLTLKKTSEERFEKLEAKLKAPEKPTPEQVEEARKSTEKLDALKAEFPEWGGAFDEQNQNFQQQIKDLREEVLAKVPANSDKASDGTEEVDEKIAIGVLDIAHKGWKNTINTQDFQDFAFQDGPTTAERAVYFHLVRSEDPESSEMFAGFLEKYPDWGEKYGTLLGSSKASDVGELLDQFEEARTAQYNEDQLAAHRRSNLEKGTAATKGSSRVTRTAPATAEEGFAAGFGDEA